MRTEYSDHLFWIQGRKTIVEDRKFLESIRVSIGHTNVDGEFKDCIIPEEAFKVLGPLWGITYLWGPEKLK